MRFMRYFTSPTNIPVMVHNPRDEDVTRFIYADGISEKGYHGLARSGLLLNRGAWLDCTIPD